jgi:hypothetical protein
LEGLGFHPCPCAPEHILLLLLLLHEACMWGGVGCRGQGWGAVQGP